MRIYEFSQHLLNAVFSGSIVVFILIFGRAFLFWDLWPSEDLEPWTGVLRAAFLIGVIGYLISDE